MKNPIVYHDEIAKGTKRFDQLLRMIADNSNGLLVTSGYPFFPEQAKR